jgi:hypothetical protein
MVTGYPQLLVGPHTTSLEAEQRREVRQGVVGRAFRRIGQFICGISGHDRVRHYEQNRVSLMCASCGHISPGWELTAPLPQVRYAGDPKRHQLRPAPTRVAGRRVA